MIGILVSNGLRKISLKTYMSCFDVHINLMNRWVQKSNINLIHHVRTNMVNGITWPKFPSYQRAINLNFAFFGRSVRKLIFFTSYNFRLLQINFSLEDGFLPSNTILESQSKILASLHSSQSIKWKIFFRVSDIRPLSL